MSVMYMIIIVTFLLAAAAPASAALTASSSVLASCYSADTFLSPGESMQVSVELAFTEGSTGAASVLWSLPSGGSISSATIASVGSSLTAETLDISSTGLTLGTVVGASGGAPATYLVSATLTLVGSDEVTPASSHTLAIEAAWDGGADSDALLLTGFVPVLEIASYAVLEPPPAEGWQAGESMTLRAVVRHDTSVSDGAAWSLGLAFDTIGSVDCAVYADSDPGYSTPLRSFAPHVGPPLATLAWSELLVCEYTYVVPSWVPIGAEWVLPAEAALTYAATPGSCAATALASTLVTALPTAVPVHAIASAALALGTHCADPSSALFAGEALELVLDMALPAGTISSSITLVLSGEWAAADAPSTFGAASFAAALVSSAVQAGTTTLVFNLHPVGVPLTREPGSSDALNTVFTLTSTAPGPWVEAGPTLVSAVVSSAYEALALPELVLAHAGGLLWAAGEARLDADASTGVVAFTIGHVEHIGAPGSGSSVPVEISSILLSVADGIGVDGSGESYLRIGGVDSPVTVAASGSGLVVTPVAGTLVLAVGASADVSLALSLTSACPSCAQDSEFAVTVAFEEVHACGTRLSGTGNGVLSVARSAAADVSAAITIGCYEYAVLAADAASGCGWEPAAEDGATRRALHELACGAGALSPSPSGCYALADGAGMDAAGGKCVASAPAWRTEAECPARLGWPDAGADPVLGRRKAPASPVVCTPSRAYNSYSHRHGRMGVRMESGCGAVEFTCTVSDCGLQSSGYSFEVPIDGEGVSVFAGAGSSAAAVPGADSYLVTVEPGAGESISFVVTFDGGEQDAAIVAEPRMEGVCGAATPLGASLTADPLFAAAGPVATGTGAGSEWTSMGADGGVARDADGAGVVLSGGSAGDRIVGVRAAGGGATSFLVYSRATVAVGTSAEYAPYVSVYADALLENGEWVYGKHAAYSLAKGGEEQSVSALFKYERGVSSLFVYAMFRLASGSMVVHEVSVFAACSAACGVDSPGLVFGDPHLVTLSGTVADFQATGDALLARDASIEVHARLAAASAASVVSGLAAAFTGADGSVTAFSILRNEVDPAGAPPTLAYAVDGGPWLALEVGDAVPGLVVETEWNGAVADGLAIEVRSRKTPGYGLKVWVEVSATPAQYFGLEVIVPVSTDPAGVAGILGGTSPVADLYTDTYLAAVTPNPALFADPVPLVAPAATSSVTLESFTPVEVTVASETCKAFVASPALVAACALDLLVTDDASFASGYKAMAVYDAGSPATDAQTPSGDAVVALGAASTAAASKTVNAATVAIGLLVALLFVLCLGFCGLLWWRSKPEDNDDVEAAVKAEVEKRLESAVPTKSAPATEASEVEMKQVRVRRKDEDDGSYFYVYSDVGSSSGRDSSIV